MRCFGILYVVVLFLIGCDDDPAPAAEPSNQPDSGPEFTIIPRLGPGPHVGMIAGFDLLTTDVYDQPGRIADLTAQAISAGMNVSRVQIDWSELETAAGQYDVDAMNELLSAVFDTSLPAYVTLSTLDSDGFTLPDYLMTDERLRDDLTISSPEVINAFENFLDWFVPQLDTAGVWGLSIGNEGDSLLADELVNSEDFVTFFRAGLERVNAVGAILSSSVTFTGGAFVQFPQETQAILEQSDHATVNYYCLDAGLQVTEESTWDAYLAELKEAVGTKSIFFQELGCPVGYGDDGEGAPARPPNGMGGDSAAQARFVEYMGDAFVNDAQFIGATWFQLLDWSPELAESFSAPIALAGEPLAAALTEEWLATSGLCRWADGTCRPAWDQWLQTLTAVQVERVSRQ